MSDELKEQITDLGHYYRRHKIRKMIKSHPEFVAEDFAKLLGKLHAEIEPVNSRANDYTERHEKLRQILINNNCPEYGDAIIDEICELFGARLTPDIEDSRP